MEDQQYVSYSPDVAQDSNPPAEPAAPVERQPDSEEGKLFIGNLSYATAAADLENEFGRYGAIASARVIVDHATERSRGFGFVTFVDPACALDALAMNDQEFMGRIIKVNQSTPKAPRSEGDRRRGDGEGRREYDRGYVDRGGYGDRRDDRTREPRRDDRGGGQPYPTDRGYGDRGYADRGHADRGHADRGGYGSTGAGRDRGGYDRRDDRGYGDRGIDVRGGAGGYDRGYGGDRGYGHDRGGSAGAGYANDRGGYGADRGGYAGSRGYADRGAGYHAPVERGGRDRSQDRGVGGGYATGGARGGGYGGDRNGGGGYGDRNGSGGGYGERGGYDRGGPYGARGGGDDRGYSGGGGYGDRGGYPGGDRGSNERGYGGGGGGRGVCFSWQKGTCKYGDSCRFVHEGPAGGGGAAPSQHAAY